MEGDGARVFRAIGTSLLPGLDPFIGMDNVDTTRGQFPDHPPRGFEVIAYVLEGKVLHEDSKHNSGETTEGGGQWMTAGRGIVHCEKLEGRVNWIVLWVNLKAGMKMCEPGYQVATMGTIKRAEDRGAGTSAAIFAGTALGQTAETVTRTPTAFIDFKLNAGSVLTQPVTPGWSSLLFVVEGRVLVAGVSLGAKEVAVLSPMESAVMVQAEKQSRLIFIAGEPIREPVCWYGPFVMNTREEIVQTFDDYQHGRNGFEGAETWKSQLFYGGERQLP